MADLPEIQRDAWALMLAWMEHDDLAHDALMKPYLDDPAKAVALIEELTDLLGRSLLRHVRTGDPSASLRARKACAADRMRTILSP